MASPAFRHRFQSTLEPADIRLDGDRPWDVQVRDERLFDLVRQRGLVGLGDAYVEAYWDCDAIDQFFDRALSANMPARFRRHPATIARCLIETLFNLQSVPRARRNAQHHYDMGPELFEATLDPYVTYSCAYWRHADNLNDAQVAKLDLVCRKLDLEPGMRVLDIGSGWGSFVRFAAERYGCRLVGITPSTRQVEYSRRRCEGLPVEIRQQDYRELNERFDRIVSIGMFEHVGPKNHRAFMRIVRHCLDDDGLALLHFFATQRPWPNRQDGEVLWIQTHIFPGMVVPSLGQVGTALDGRLVTEDLENFGADYDRTLMAWHKNFTRNWSDLRGDQYDERFHRLWTYYLLSCAGAFRARKYQVWQFVLSRNGIRGGYRRPDTLELRTRRAGQTVVPKIVVRSEREPVAH